MSEREDTPLLERAGLVLALIMPLLAWGLQTLAWDWIRPTAFLLFYPAVFFAAWLGGWRGGVAATLLSAGLVGGFFMEPSGGPTPAMTADLPRLAVFTVMGFVFAGFHERHRTQVREQARLLAEVALSERRFRTMFEEAPLGIALTDSRTRELYDVNPRFAEIVGRTRAELKGLDWKDITEPGDAQRDMDNMARLNAGEIGGFRMDKRFQRPDPTARRFGLA